MEISSTAKSLLEIISTKHISNAARVTKRLGTWYEWSIAIGNDEVAYITMTKEVFEALEQATLHPTNL